MACRRSCNKITEACCVHIRRSSCASSAVKCFEKQRSQFPMYPQEATFEASGTRSDRGNNAEMLPSWYLPGHLHSWYRPSQTGQLMSILPPKPRLAQAVRSWVRPSPTELDESKTDHEIPPSEQHSYPWCQAYAEQGRRRCAGSHEPLPQAF